MLGQNKGQGHLYSLTKISGQFENSGQFQDNFEISGISGLLGPLSSSVFLNLCRMVMNFLRGHDLKLFKQYSRLNIRKHFFSQIDAWNALRSSVVDATSVNSFKRNLDEFWKDMGIKS